MHVERRLSAQVHALARRSLGGEHGRNMAVTPFHLDAGQVKGEMGYADLVYRLAEQAPLRVLDGELIVGSATWVEATYERTPGLGEPSTSHLTPDFGKVLQVGYRGLRQQIMARLRRGDLELGGEELLRAMLRCLDAATLWHGRHIALLEERVQQADGLERASYEAVLEALRRVPEEPPATFHQAVMALWFAFAFQRLCGNWPGIGRIDAYLWPFLEADLQAGQITIDQAREILAHFWVKGSEWAGAPGYGRGTNGDAQFYQNIILSGCDAEGRDLTNPVTYLVLDIVEELFISDFPIAVRISRQTPERLLRRLAEVMRLGGGIVAVYNEETVIQALVRFGYPIEVARGFANDGCWEVQIPGQTAFSYHPFDMLRLLQETLGVVGPGPAACYATFEAVYAAFLVHLESYLEQWQATADGYRLGGRPAPLISLLVDDCIERARGYNDRGARYTVFSPHAGGLPDVADSLLAIKRFVFDQQVVTLDELVASLRSDWAGDEVLRRRIRSQLEGYGNDNQEANEMVRRVFDDYVRLAGQVHDRAGVLRPVGLSTFGRQIEWAPKRGATAAGSHAGDYLANNFSPSPGIDHEGPTAVLKSYCAVDFGKLPNGTALDLKLHPSATQGEEGLSALVGLLKTFVALGGLFMHLDVVDSALLREAQRHPERYPNLVVRVSGWSARFATLSREWQDMVIQRTEQVLR
jgi:formate C-acetyltransferase